MPGDWLEAALGGFHGGGGSVWMAPCVLCGARTYINKTDKAEPKNSEEGSSRCMVVADGLVVFFFTCKRCSLFSSSAEMSQIKTKCSKGHLWSSRLLCAWYTLRGRCGLTSKGRCRAG